MEIIDSHCHVSEIWYEPHEALVYQMRANGVHRAVMVQINGHFNNNYQMSRMRSDPERFASVVAVDPRSSTACRDLRVLAEHGAIGLRLRPTDRTPEGDGLAIWREAERCDLSVSCSGTMQEFASSALREVAEAIPTLKLVIEHAGGMNHPNDQEPLDLRREVFQLARYPSIYVKIHGLGEFSRPAPSPHNVSPFVDPIPPVLEMAGEFFGAKRMMWGSDFPPVSAREGYGNALGIPAAHLSGLATADREWIFGRTAANLYFPRK